MAVMHAAIIFFVGYYAITVNGQKSTTDLFCFGKVRVAVCGVCVVVVCMCVWCWWGMYANMFVCGCGMVCM